MSTIDAETKHVGLLGWPVEHSISPAMFNAAFETLGINWHYKAYPVPADQLKGTVNSLAEKGIYGVNVTVPHKRAVMTHLNVITPAAKAVGAVNTITVRTGNEPNLHGTNTDVQGFKEDLKQFLEPKQKRVTRALILGAGGAARAAAYILSQMGYQITVAAREPTQALDLIREVQMGLSAIGIGGRPQKFELGSGTTEWRLQMLAIPWDRIHQVAKRANVIVNCTTVGMWPNVDESPWPEEAEILETSLIYDMVYRPVKTKFVQQAEAAGAKAVSGLGMLVRQGAAAFKLWTEQEPPLDVMFEAAKKALAEEGE